MKAERFQEDLLEWYQDNLRDLPWRKPDVTPYELLTAEIFLKQTRTETVERIHPEFIKAYPSLHELQGADRPSIIEIISPLGLYNDRADALMEIGHRLAGSGVPDDQDALMELPQVGRYIANATLCFAHDQRYPIVDTNVRRVYSRVLGGEMFDGLSYSEQWELAERMLPENRVRQYNLALLDLGATLCTDTSPDCNHCFAREYCEYYQRHREM